MEILIQTGGVPEADVPLGVFTFKDRLGETPYGIEPGSCNDEVYRRMVAGGEIAGETGEAPYAITCNPTGPYRIFFIGLGGADGSAMEDFRKAGASVNRRLRRFNMTKIDFLLPELPSLSSRILKRNIQAFTEGFILRNYDFDKYRDETIEGTVERIRLLEKDESRLEVLVEGVRLGKLFGNATNYCRDLANEPANFLTPVKMAERAMEIADQSPRIEAEILDRKQIEKIGMGLLLGVARASSHPPYVIILNYDSGQKNAPTIGLVGKGVTFDAGGLSIKRAKGMFDMKRDLSGGAAVLSALHAVARMDLKVNVIALVGAAENMVGSNAMRPGDIIRSLSGKTVEVLNTDAEGRLILADLLTYLQDRWKPDCIIDIATLSGSIANAFGRNMSGILANNDDLFLKLRNAADRSSEKIWRMPLEEQYRQHTMSHFADLKNLSDNAPDSMFSGLFLQEFVNKDVPWAHLDIAGTETHFGEPSTYYVRGATGVGTRLLLEFILAESQSPDALQWCYDEKT